MLLAQSLLNER